MTQKLCLHAEFGVNKAVFLTSVHRSQRMELGELSSACGRLFFGTPACCQSTQMNEHDQLPAHVVDKTHTVDSVHLLCQVLLAEIHNQRDVNVAVSKCHGGNHLK